MWERWGLRRKEGEEGHEEEKKETEGDMGEPGYTGTGSYLQWRP